ncbi:ankyrin repeat-containing protein [Stemphylium lycopersici]|nr:ankyrin repeat-containing protein [Stemphylium lycopersici]
MEGLSIAANGLAVVSAAFQLTEACVKLYRFWESVEDAPQEIAAINEDLQYLITIFRRIESNTEPLGECIAEGIEHCRACPKVSRIVERDKIDFDSCPGPSMSQRYTISATSNFFRGSQHNLNLVKSDSFSSSSQSIDHVFPTRHHPGALATYTEQESLPGLSIWETYVAKTVLMDSKKNVPNQAIANMEIQELMLHAIGQTATPAFESGSLDILARDGYTVDHNGTLRAGTFVYSENLRYRVSHHATSFRTAFGCVWIRKTTLYLPVKVDDADENTQCVTSFIFYPNKWIQWLGVRNGLEAVVASAGRSWLLNCRLTVTRAIPEDSLLFELCKTGQTRAVETLFSKGLGSVVDTSPKGWKPLHFAAAGGHVDLCAMLIEAGADKTALVYEGPSSTILSPISLFVASAHDLHADVKISMLRLFSDCIELTDAKSDGWTVHEWLKRTYLRESVPISQNSITWLLHGAATEESADRSYIDAIGLWLALRVVGRVLLPMVLSAGSICQIGGFEWVNNDLTHRQYSQALPSIYEAWCRAVLDSTENLERYLRLELEQYLQQTERSRAEFLDAVSYQDTTARSGSARTEPHNCTQCATNYSSLPDAIVAPIRIAVTECVNANHRFGCVCHELNILDPPTQKAELPEYFGRYDMNDVEETASEDIFFDAESHLLSNVIPSHNSTTSGMFTEVAALLYSAHGRTWLGHYEADELLCAPCFLLRERYIDSDGVIADFSPRPDHFDGLRFRW